MKILLGLLMCFSLCSCSDRPARAKFPGPPGRTSEFQQAQKTQEVLGGFDSFGRQTGRRQETTISGIVSLGEGMRAPQKNFIIFISARPLAGGPPLAVKKMKIKKFPFRFMLTEADAMMAGTRFSGFVNLSVRVDQAEEDGRFDPLSRQTGDLAAAVRVKVGTQDLRVTLDQLIE